MIKICCHWDCPDGSSFEVKRQLYQYYDFTAKAWGVTDIYLIDVDGDSSATIAPPNKYPTLQDVIDRHPTLTPVYISTRGTELLSDFVHPVDALYITGPNYLGYRIPADVVSVRIDVVEELWAHVALALVLMDRQNKGG